MSTPVPTRVPATRPSHLGIRVVVVPVIALLVGAAVAAVAARELDRLYRRGAAVVWPGQLLPYALAEQRKVDGGEPGGGDPERDRMKELWRTRARVHGDAVAALAWREEGGYIVVAVAVRTPNPSGTAAALLAASDEAADVGSWVEGDRFAMVVVVVGAGDDVAAARVFDQRVAVVRDSARLQRALSLTVAAVAFVLVPVVAAPFAFVLRWFHLLAAAGRAVRLAPTWLVRRRRTASSLPATGLRPGVRVAKLSRTVTPPVLHQLDLVQLLFVAIPACILSLWPGALLWALVVGVSCALESPRTRGQRGVSRLMRWGLEGLLLVGLGHGLLGWPASSPLADSRILLALAGAALLVTWRLWTDRTPGSAFGAGALTARWLAVNAGFVLVAGASIALFLGSNGETDLRTQLVLKGIALPGVVAAPFLARRVRVARGHAQRRLRRKLGRPEVLYLRSFSDDRMRVRSKQRTRVGLERFVPWPTEGFEEVLLRNLERVGPVTSIGKPGSRQSEFGAARDLVVGDDWVAVVRARLRAAPLTTVVLGNGAGLETELRILHDEGALDRVCLVVPPVTRATAAERISVCTLALERGRAWGHITTGHLPGRGDIVALVGIGEHRLVLTADRRLASTYLDLADALTALLHDVQTAVTAFGATEVVPA